MFQNTTNNTIKIVILFLFSGLVFSSCAKKPSGVRATIKTQQTNLNPSVSAQADMQGASASADYKISTIAIPTQTSDGFVVDVELLNPSGQVLPLSTHHENGNSDSEGVYTDSQRGLQVHILARCSAQDNCSKYTIIVTTLRNNQEIYQAAAISFKDDCKFNAVSSSFNVGQFLQSLNELNNKYNIAPTGDGDSCTI